MGAEYGRAHVGRRGSKCAFAEEHGEGVPRNGGDDAETSCAAAGRGDDFGGGTRGGSYASARAVPLIAPLKDTKFKFMGGLRVFARWLCATLFIALAISATAAQQRVQVAITVDDLPVHGDLPSTMTRAEIA